MATIKRLNDVIAQLEGEISSLSEICQDLRMQAEELEIDAAICRRLKEEGTTARVEYLVAVCQNQISKIENKIAEGKLLILQARYQRYLLWILNQEMYKQNAAWN